MISKVGSLESSRASTGARLIEARPATSKARSAINTGNEPSAPKAAAVVQIGGQARTLASQAEAAPQSRLAELGGQRAAAATGQTGARPRLGDSSEARAEIEIEPVVAQPVPDFNPPTQEAVATSARSVYSSSSASGGGASQAASSGRQFVA